MGPVAEKVIQVVKQEFPLGTSFAAMTSELLPLRFVENFGADDLDMVELIMAIEEAFELCIDDVEAANIKTVQDLVNYVENEMKNEGREPEVPPVRDENRAEWKDQQLVSIGDLAKLVAAENQRQLNKWGVQKYDVFTWHAILAEEVGELAKAMLEYKFGSKSTTAEEIHKEAIQVATLAMKIAEMASLK